MQQFTRNSYSWSDGSSFQEFENTSYLLSYTTLTPFRITFNNLKFDIENNKNESLKGLYYGYDAGITFISNKLNVTAEHCTHADDGGNHCIKKVHWYKMSKEQLATYTMLTDNNLASVKFDHSLVLCDDPECKDPAHISAINTYLVSSNY